MKFVLFHFANWSAFWLSVLTAESFLVGGAALLAFMLAWDTFDRVTQ